MVTVRTRLFHLLLRVPVSVHKGAGISTNTRGADVFKVRKLVLVQVILGSVVAGCGSGVCSTRNAETILGFAKGILRLLIHH